MLTFLIYLFGALLVLSCLLLVLLVLMQRPKQEGLGAAFGAGVTDQIWGSQTTNVLQKGTVFLATLFFGLSLTLTILKARKAGGERLNLPETKPVPAQTESSLPADSGTGTLPVNETTVPADPAPPVETPAPADTPAQDATTPPAETPAQETTPPPVGEAVSPEAEGASGTPEPSTDDAAPGESPATPEPEGESVPAPEATPDLPEPRQPQ